MKTDMKRPAKGPRPKNKDAASPFTSVVFAGGGNRCMWEVGFWSVASKELGIRPDVVAGVSAGASMACLIFSGTIAPTLAYFKEITGANRKNWYPSRIFSARKVFPHSDMYRSALLHSIDTKALTRLHNGPEIRVLITRPPAWLGPRSATLVGLGAYTIEKKLKNPVHPAFASRLGFTPQVVTVREARTPDELADLLLSSSCTPPFTPIMRWCGNTSLDGGLIDNVPVRALEKEDGNTLVLMTRRYPESAIPVIPGRTYVQPSVPIGIVKWDYTNPKGIQEAYDLGVKDGEQFVRYFSRSK